MVSIAAGRSRSRVLAAAIAMAVTFAACSGGDDAAPSTTAAVTVPTTDAAVTTAPPTTQPTTTTTTTVEATTAQTTSAPTTVAPTVSATVDPANAEPVVAQVMVDYINAVNELGRDPASEDRRAALAVLASGEPLDLFIQNADESVINGEFNRVDPADPSRVEPITGTFSYVDATSPVGMDGCVIDTDAQVSIGADGVEQAAETTPDSFLMSFTFTSIDGRWMVTDLIIDQRFEDQVGCG